MKNHELKILPEYFLEVVNGNKTFEVRHNDRDFQIGDYVTLKEYNGETNEYTGRLINVKITYILDNPNYCKEGFVIFSFDRLSGVI